MKILAFGASSSKNPIKKLATYAVYLKTGSRILDLNEYQMPYSVWILRKK
jgi:hypothetical protein